MYASEGSVGLTSRSRSSTDVFRESRLDKSETKFQSSYSTLGRSSRRPRAPTPPPRASPIKCYLSEDIRRQYENGYEAAEPVEPQNSFVRRLVATLERRQQDGKVNLPARLAQAHRPTLPGKPEGAPLPSRRQLPRQPWPELPARGFPPSRPFCPLDRPFSQPIHEDEDDESTSEDSDFWSEATDSLPGLNSQPGEPALGEASPSLKRIAQRALRKLGALIGRRAGRGLPKGTRDYYATRESLSDELGSFRRNTMPQLIKEARPGSADSTDQRRLDQIERDRQLAELIGSSQPIAEPEGPRRRPSTATIHPIYGKPSHAGQALDERPGPGPICGRPASGRGSGDNFGEASGVYAALPIPIKGSARLNSGSLDNNEHLLRPSRVRDLEKSLSRQEDAVQLRQAAEVIYDVPKSNRPVSLSSLSSMSSAATIPIYENADLFAVTDQRLNLPGFTTF